MSGISSKRSPEEWRSNSPFREPVRRKSSEIPLSQSAQTPKSSEVPVAEEVSPENSYSVTRRKVDLDPLRSHAYVQPEYETRDSIIDPALLMSSASPSIETKQQSPQLGDVPHISESLRLSSAATAGSRTLSDYGNWDPERSSTPTTVLGTRIVITGDTASDSNGSEVFPQGNVRTTAPSGSAGDLLRILSSDPSQFARARASQLAAHSSPRRVEPPTTVPIEPRPRPSQTKGGKDREKTPGPPLRTSGRPGSTKDEPAARIAASRPSSKLEEQLRRITSSSLTSTTHSVSAPDTPSRPATSGLGNSSVQDGERRKPESQISPPITSTTYQSPRRVASPELEDTTLTQSLESLSSSDKTSEKAASLPSSNKELDIRKSKLQQKFKHLELPEDVISVLHGILQNVFQGDFETGIQMFIESYEALLKSTRESRNRPDSDTSLLMKRMKDAENQAKNLTSTRDELEAKAEKLKAETKEWKTRNERLREKSEDQKKEIARLQRRIAKADEDYYSFKNSSDADTTALRDKLEEAESAKQDLAKSLRLAKEANTKRLQLADAGLRDQLEQSKSDQKTMTERIKNLELDKKTALEEIKRMKEARSSEERENSEYKAKIQELDIEVRLERDSKKLLLVKLDELKSANSNPLNDACTISLETEIQELKSRQKYNEDLILQKTEASNAVTSQNEKLQEELASLVKEKERLQSQLREKQVETQALSHDLSDLLDIQQKAETLSHDLRKAKKVLEEKDKALDHERELLKSEKALRSISETELLESQQKVDNLTGVLEKLKKDHDSQTKALYHEQKLLESEKELRSISNAMSLESQQKIEALSNSLGLIKRDLDNRTNELIDDRKSLQSEKASKSAFEAKLVESQLKFKILSDDFERLKGDLAIKNKQLDQERHSLQDEKASKTALETELLETRRLFEGLLVQNKTLEAAKSSTAELQLELNNLVEAGARERSELETRLQTEIRNLEAELLLLQGTLSSRDRSDSETRNQLQNDKSVLVQERNTLKQKNAILNEEKKALEDKKRVLEQEKKKLEQERMVLLQQKNSVEKDAANAEKNWLSLIQQLQEEMNNSKRELDSQVHSLQDQLATERAKKLVTDTKQESRSGEPSKDKYEAGANSASPADITFKRKIAQLEKELTVRIQSEEGLEHRIKALRLELKEKTKIENSFEAQLQEAHAAYRDEKKKLKSQLKERKDELAKLIADIGKLQERNSMLQESIQQRRATETSTAQIQIDNLISEIENLRDRTVTLQSQLDKSISERDEQYVIAQRREGQINLRDQEIQKMRDAAHNAAQEQRHTYSHIEKLKSDFASQEEAAQRLQQEVAILSAKIDYKDKTIAELQGLIESSTHQTDGMDLLRQQIDEKTREIERLQESFHGQEEQVRKAQVAAFRNLETVKHAFLEDNEIEQKLKHEVFANLEKWVREYVPRKKAVADEKLSENTIAELAMLSNPDLIDVLSQKHPQIIVQALLSHFAVENLLKQPFRLLYTGKECSGPQECVSGVLQNLYDSFLQHDVAQGHDWRFKTFQLLSQVRSQPSPTLLYQKNDFRKAQAEYCELLAQSFISGTAGTLLGSCNNEAERLEKLVRAFDGIAEVSLKLWSQKAFLTVRGFSDFQDTPFSWESTHVQAHALHHLSRPGKTHSRDGDLISMVVQPEIVAYGNEEGSEYDKEKVWARAVVALSV